MVQFKGNSLVLIGVGLGLTINYVLYTHLFYQGDMSNEARNLNKMKKTRSILNPPESLSFGSSKQTIYLSDDSVKRNETVAYSSAQ